MTALMEMIIYSICTLFTLLKPGGVKSLIAENLALKQQLIVINRSKHRAPKLETSDRFFFAFIRFLLVTNELVKLLLFYNQPQYFVFTKH